MIDDTVKKERLETIKERQKEKKNDRRKVGERYNNV